MKKKKALRAWFYGRAYHTVPFPWEETTCGRLVEDAHVYDPVTVKGYTGKHTKDLPLCKHCERKGNDNG